MLLAAAGFATMATFAGAAHALDPGLSTLVTSAARSAVNLVALLLLSLPDPRRLAGDGRRSLWTRGVLGACSLLTYFAALAWVGIGEAAFLNQTSAVWVAVLAPMVLGERTGRLTWVAVLGSLVGVALLAQAREVPGDLAGRVAGLASGLFAAGAYLSIRRASATNTPLTIVFYFTFIASIVSTGLVLVTGAALPRDPAVWGCLVGSGLAATGAQLLMTEAYRTGRAGPVAAAGAAGPLLNTLAGWIVLAQVPDARAGVGMAVLLLTGVALPFAAARESAREPAAG